MKRILTPVTALLGSLALVVVANVSLASAADDTAVTIENFAFAPAEMTVEAGSTVTWTNVQSARHTTTADGGAWDSGVMSTGTAFAFTFNEVGDFSYHCDIHEEMVAVVHVVAPATEPATVVVAEEPVAEAAAPAAEVVEVTPTPTPSTYGY